MKPRSQIQRIAEEVEPYRNRRDSFSVQQNELAAWKLRQLGLSFPAIARVMLGHDPDDTTAQAAHTTAMHRVRRYEERISQ